MMPASFPLDVEDEVPLDYGNPVDSVHDNSPLFLSSDDESEFDLGDVELNRSLSDNHEVYAVDRDPTYNEDDHDIDEHDIDDDVGDDAENDDAEEEIVSSMMTGGRFTREQVLEVKDLAKTLVTTLGRRAKAWKRPLDAVMRIANLVIATKERRAGGNAWNAFQNAFAEDPDKATRK
jgi:hypothetical protein